MKAVFIDNASFVVTACNDFIAFLIKDAGCIETYVAETLDGNPCLSRVPAQSFQGLFEYIYAAEGGGVVAHSTPAHFDRLAGNSSRDVHALDPFVLVEHPCHYLLVGIDIRSRYILERPYIISYGSNITARQLLQLVSGKLLRIDNNPTL